MSLHVLNHVSYIKESSRGADMMVAGNCNDFSMYVLGMVGLLACPNISVG